MNKNLVLKSKRLYLRKLRKGDITKVYLGWLNDPIVNKYMECRFRRHTITSLLKYYANESKDNDCFFMGIFLADKHRHIGNIKLHRIDWQHRNGELGIMIGEKDCWGKGYAAEAIKLLVDHAFNRLKLHKVYASIYSVNKNSIRAFKKAGFFIDSIKKEHYLFNHRFLNEVSMAILNRCR